MRFTRRTYRVAIRRAFQSEYLAFCDHQQALRGPDPWFELMQHTRALESRRARER